MPSLADQITTEDRDVNLLWNMLRGVAGSRPISVSGVIPAGEPTFDVKHPSFSGGAKGDGVTDDTAAIQAAVNATGSTGGRIFFPVGIYKITSPITVPSGVYLEGASYSAQESGLAATAGAILLASGSLTSILNVTGTGGSSEGTPKEAILIRSLTLDGATTAQRGILLQNFRDVSLQNVRIKRINGPCVNALRATNGVSYRLEIEDCWFSNSTSGLSSSGTPSGAGKVFLDVLNTEFRAMTTNGIVGCFTGQVAGGFIGGTTGVGVSLDGSLDGGATISASTFSIRDLSMENCGTSFVKVRNFLNFNMWNLDLSTSNVGSFPQTIGVDVDTCTGGVFAGIRVDADSNSDSYIGIQLGSGVRQMALLNPSWNGFTGNQVQVQNNAPAGDILLWERGGLRAPLWTYAQDASSGTAYQRYVGLSGSNYVLQAFSAVADANERFRLIASGQLNWGPGAGTAVDTNLYRGGVAQLKTDGSFAYVGALIRSKQSPAFSATPTPDPTLGEIYAMAALTGNVTVAAPANGATGQHLRFYWTQDGTGGRTVTYNAVYKTGGAAAFATTLSTVTIDDFECIDGTNWRLVSRITGQAI